MWMGIFQCLPPHRCPAPSSTLGPTSLRLFTVPPPSCSVSLCSNDSSRWPDLCSILILICSLPHQSSATLVPYFLLPRVPGKATEL